jgi:Pilus formation protein N terminal region
MRRDARFALFSAASLLLTTVPAWAANLSVPMDEVRIVAFNEPVSTVYVGDPVIADVTMIDARHAFLLGKAFGETNLIALGANGRTISNDHVTVLGQRVGEVTLNRGAETYTYTCTAQRCETQAVPGDAKDYYSAAQNAIEAHEDLNQKAAAGGSQQQH